MPLPCKLPLQHLESLLSERTRVVSIVLVSNMLGFITDMEAVVRLARKVSAQCTITLLVCMKPLAGWVALSYARSSRATGRGAPLPRAQTSLMLPAPRPLSIKGGALSAWLIEL